MAEVPERPLYQITAKPGFARDGTQLDNNSFIDGQWCRFYLGRPKKIGGYKAISKNLPAVSRGAYVYTRGGFSYVYGMSANKVFVATTNQFANTSVAAASTLPDHPAVDEYSFSIDSIYKAS